MVMLYIDISIFAALAKLMHLSSLVTKELGLLH